jgi:O-glycosyl hydrolase
VAAGETKVEVRSLGRVGRLDRRGFLKLGATALAGAALAAGSGEPRFLSADRSSVAHVRKEPSQTMQGFGASGAWWPNDLVHFDPGVQRRVGELLFDREKGIGLSVYRYNIGGGGVGVRIPAHAPQTFLVRPGVYDWSRDPGGRLFLRMAEEHGVPVLVGFVNSAPAIWTSNHLNTGCYLIRGAEPHYARYLADIAEHFESEGITLSYISPMNEPDYIWGGGVQEGMAVPIIQRAEVIKYLGGELARRAPRSRIVADESSQVGTQFIPEVPAWMSTTAASEWVAALAHHLYDYPDGRVLRRARELVGEYFDRPMWMTEISCWNSRTKTYGRQYDPTMTSALWMANTIWQSLTQANDAAWHWWVALSSTLGCDPLKDPGCTRRINYTGYDKGLLYYDPNYRRNGNQKIYFTKRYWVMGNFSRFVRPGFLRYDVKGTPPGLRVLAFSGENGWQIVAINHSSSQRTLHLRLPEPDLKPSGAFETSERRDLERVSPPRLGKNLLSAVLGGRSVTTLLLARPGS